MFQGQDRDRGFENTEAVGAGSDYQALCSLKGALFQPSWNAPLVCPLLESLPGCLSRLWSTGWDTDLL